MYDSSKPNTMDYASINVTLTAVRSAPAENSYMINQLLFGEIVQIHRNLNNWLYVESVFDRSRGWINNLSRAVVSPAKKSDLDKKRVVIPWLNRITHAEGKEYNLQIMPGSEVFLHGPDKQKIERDGVIYALENALDEKIKNSDRLSILKTAQRFFNTPYLSGGRSPFGADGAGLFQVVFKIHGIQVPRLMEDLVDCGSAISFIADAQPCDLVFFDDDKGKISHVGMVIENRKILHAFGSVRIDLLDHQGIYREDSGEYTHQLRTIRNILD
jgi:hypothetical protein